MAIFTVAMRKLQLDVGSRWGAWTVMTVEGTKCLCRCACGALQLVAAKRLVGGQSKRCRRCGCKASWAGGARKYGGSQKHGEARKRAFTPEYKAWRAMLVRVRPKRKDAANYAERGITVCAEWRGVNGFANFLKELGRKPDPSLTLDRINNNLGYVPGNVRWATRQEQFRNSRRVDSTRYEHAGLRLTLREWAEKTGIARVTLDARINRYGWPISKAVTTPSKRNRGG